MSNNKNQLYILGFSLIIILIIVIFVVSHRWNHSTNNNGSGSVATQSAAAQYKPDETRGDINATIDADISLRDVDFSFSQDDVKENENAADDTLSDPSILHSEDGFTYITYRSNPDNPISYHGFTVSTEGTSCLTYVFKEDKLDEVRIQFGITDEAVTSGILNWINSSYGESTFYRSSGGSEIYWWKTEKNLLMFNSDSTGTTLFFRQN